MNKRRESSLVAHIEHLIEALDRAAMHVCELGCTCNPEVRTDKRRKVSHLRDCTGLQLAAECNRASAKAARAIQRVWAKP